MTESEWLGCATGCDTGKMDEYLRGKSDARKLRLFACACCRRIEGLLTDARSLRSLEIAEQYADGGTDGEALSAAWDEADRAASEIDDATDENGDPRPYYAALSAHWCVIPASDEADAISVASHSAFYALRSAEPSLEAVAQSRLLPEIMGRPPQLARSHLEPLTPTVISLAQSAYEERLMPSGELDPARLAVLSDALEEAGCDNADILDHLRSTGPHVRGCWALDLILGKS